MIIKFLPTIIVFLHTVHANPQFNLADGILSTGIDSMSALSKVSANSSGLLNITSGVDQIGGLAKVAVNSTQQIAESLKGLIENFGDFKTIFNKTYISAAEEKLREGIFKANLKLVSGHNKLFKSGKEAFSLAMNFFGDLKREEYLKILGTDLSKAPNASNNASSKNRLRRNSRSNNCQHPVEKDWRKDGAVSPVKHQYQCGSCWAFASTGAFESHYFLKYGKLPNFSEQQLVDCAESNGKGCDGSFMYTAYEYVMKNGIVTNDEYPYKAEESGAQNKCKKLRSKVKISTYQPIDPNEAAVKDAVCRIGPLAIAMDASPTNFWLYHGGIYRDPECSTDPNDVNHAMLIVGYGTDSRTKEPYWLIKNSYGTSWGENGYIRIPRDPKHSCSVEKLASYPIF